MKCIYCKQYCIRGACHEHCKRDAVSRQRHEQERPNEPPAFLCGPIDVIEESRIADREAAEAGDNSAQLRQAARRNARSQGRTQA